MTFIAVRGSYNSSLQPFYVLSFEIQPLTSELGWHYLHQHGLFILAHSTSFPPPCLLPFLFILISFALHMVIYLPDLYLPTTNKLGYHAPPLLLFLLSSPFPHTACSPLIAGSVSCLGQGSWLMRCRVKVRDGVCHGGCVRKLVVLGFCMRLYCKCVKEW